MNDLLSKILAEKRAYTPDGQAFPLHSHIDQLEGEVLQFWIGEKKPEHILEIGMAYGVSSLFICDAIRQRMDVTYDIIDPFQYQDWQGCGVHHLNLAGFRGRFILHEQPSEICLPRLLAANYHCDFAFVDGFHTFDHALIDFFYINRMLDVGGVVVFDDVHLSSIRKLLAYIASYPCYQALPIPATFQQHRAIRVRRMMQTPETRIAGFKKIDADKRDWRWYHEF